jgi:hypothetical protein
MANWIIDDFGDEFRSEAPEYIRRLGYTVGGPAAENYAIENMGHVGIAERDECIHVRCRPMLMQDKTISSLLYWLLDHAHKLVVVSWLDDIWHMERPMTTKCAVAFLGLVMDKRTLRRSPTSSRLLSRLSQAVAERWSRVAAETLQAADAGCAAESRRRALDDLYNGRWTVIDLELSTRRMRHAELGGGYPPLDPGLLHERSGFDFDGVGDQGYKDWVLKNFVDVAATNKPKFEDVDAVVSWPRIGDMRTRYWRAVIPLERDSHSCRLLSVSGCDSSIDLRPNLVQVSC